MEYKYDKARYNKTYYEKNKEKLRELQRQKRRKMKEALQKVEAEEQATEPDSHEPTEGLTKLFSISPILPKVCSSRLPSVAHWLHHRLRTEH